MKGIEEAKKWLLENRVDEFGNLMLSGLDFSAFDGCELEEIKDFYKKKAIQ
jgi:hypothetical protein